MELSITFSTTRPYWPISWEKQDGDSGIGFQEEWYKDNLPDSISMSVPSSFNDVGWV